MHSSHVKVFRSLYAQQVFPPSFDMSSQHKFQQPLEILGHFRKIQTVKNEDMEFPWVLKK